MWLKQLSVEIESWGQDELMKWGVGEIESWGQGKLMEC